MKHRFLFGVLVTLLGLGCHKSSISVTKADAGTLDLFSPADLRGPEDGSLVRSDSGDTIPGADVLSLGPDTILVARDTGTGVADSADVKDLRPAGETPSSPDGTGNLPRDSLAAAELPRSSDALGDGPPSPPAPESPDAKSKSADGEGDLGTDTQPLPKDVTVYANKDLATADDRCVAATPGWVSVVATFLAEDQKCWADADCTYVSFSDSCGMICVLPMNQQRIGEFGTQVYNYATANCSSCPTPSSYPTCPAPTSVYCNAGRCEYKRL
jgi:hypothetical protein